VAMLAVWIVCGFAFAILGRILGLWLSFMLSPILGLGFFILWLYMIITAFQGKTVELPVIGPVARQQA